MLRESGVLAEIQAIKRDHIDGKFPKSALFVNYYEFNAQLTLAWGRALKVKKLSDGNKEFDYEHQRGDYPPTKDYFYIIVGVNVNSDIEINGKPTVKSDLSETLAQAFENPLHELRYHSSGSYPSQQGEGYYTNSGNN